jgi:hypothetical protein
VSTPSCFRLLVALGLGAGAVQGQTAISLSALIGVPGTNAATVAGVGQVVNTTAVALNSGLTNLIASGSNGTSVFNFNTGFSDGRDRTIGSTAGAPNVWVDRKYDSASTGPLILDTNGNGSFSDEISLSGFGLHSDTFITFDLAVIRTNAGLAPNTALVLSGLAGIANTTLVPTSAAILFDSTALAVFDWIGPTDTTSRFTLTIPGNARYLSFAALSGLDGDNYFAHVGFADVQLQAVPEPSTLGLLALGLASLGLAVRRRQATVTARH